MASSQSSALSTTLVLLTPGSDKQHSLELIGRILYALTCTLFYSRFNCEHPYFSSPLQLKKGY